MRLEDPVRAESLISELDELQRREVVRVVDALVVSVLSDHTIDATAGTQLTADEARDFQRLMSDTVGFAPESEGPDDDGVRWRGRSVLFRPSDARFLAASLGPGQAALAAVVEHSWARGLGDAIGAPGVLLVEDDLLTREILHGAGHLTSLW